MLIEKLNFMFTLKRAGAIQKIEISNMNFKSRNL